MVHLEVAFTVAIKVNSFLSLYFLYFLCNKLVGGIEDTICIYAVPTDNFVSLDPPPIKIIVDEVFFTLSLPRSSTNSLFIFYIFIFFVCIKRRKLFTVTHTQEEWSYLKFRIILVMKKGGKNIAKFEKGKGKKEEKK
jgi:hypothetical protein